MPCSSSPCSARSRRPRRRIRPPPRRPRSPPTVAEPCPGDPIRLDQLTTGSFESEPAGRLRARPVRRPGRHDGRAREVLLRPARGADPERPPHARPRDLRAAARRRPAARRARVPRLGRLQPPGRDALARGLLDRGASTSPSPRGTCRARPRAASGPGRSGPAAGSPSSGSPRSPAARSGTPTTASPGGSRSSTRSDPAFADRPYRKTRYRTKPKRKKAGWYTGDLHVHAEHSALGDATMRETFGYAFGKAQARLHHADRLRHGLRLGRDRALQDRPPPGRALLGGHHLPRAHEQPDLRPLRRLPHRPGLRPRAPPAA